MEKKNTYDDFLKSSYRITISNKVLEKLNNLSKILSVEIESIILSAYFLSINAYDKNDNFFINTYIKLKIQRLEGLSLNNHKDLFSLISAINKQLIDSSSNLLNTIYEDNLYYALFLKLDELKEYTFNKQNVSYLVSIPNLSLRNITLFIKNKNFDKQTNKYFGYTFKEILNQIYKVSNKETLLNINLSFIKYVNDKLYHKIIYENNKTYREYDRTKCVHEIFEEQTQNNPSKLALVFNDICLTYKELNKLSNILSHELVKNYNINPKQNQLIVLFVDRDHNTIVTIIGVLKSGAAYVPVDINTSEEKICKILQESCCQLVITNNNYYYKVLKLIKKANIKHNCKVFVIEEISHKTEISSFNPNNKTNANNIAYIAYTSGSTGIPKAIPADHNNIINCILSSIHMYKTMSSISGAFSSYVFDIFVIEVFTPLFIGGTVHILDENTRKDASLLSNYIIKNNITSVYLPPALLANLPRLKYKSLEHIIYGGEVCNLEVSNYWRSKCKLYCVYGTTECTIYSSNMQITKKRDSELIGYPIYNTQLYVLDEQLRVLPIGAKGYLYIGGHGVAREYVYDQELSKQKFILNPFQTPSEHQQNINSKIYKTGDIVQLLLNGKIKYIGRCDDQIKIHGYRVELQEINSSLSSYPGIIQSFITVKELNNSKIIIAYFTAKKKIDHNKIFAYLNKKLPEYMIPNFFVQLDYFPTNTNGKLDKNELPIPDTCKRLIIEPCNSLQSSIRLCWSNILNIPPTEISIEDNFFRVGGNSILAIQLISLLFRKFSIKILIKDLYNHNTIKGICDFLEANNLNCTSSLQKNSFKRSDFKGQFVMLPIQNWFLQTHNINYQNWYPAYLITTRKLNTKKVQEVINELESYHDILRLRLTVSNKNIYTQYYDNSGQRKIHFIIFNINSLKAKENSKEFDDELAEHFEKWNQYINIFSGPVLLVAYIFGFKDKSARVYFAAHHLIIDLISWKILAKDFRDLYDNKKLNLQTTSYKDWINFIVKYPSLYKSEKKYWENVLSDYIISEPDIVKSALKYKASSILRLNPTQTNKLLLIAQSGSILEILLAAFSKALTQLTIKNIHYITLLSHGRIIIQDLNILNTLGWFSVMFPIRLETKENINNTLNYIKNYFLQIPNEGIGYGALYGYDSKLMPKICFNYLGNFTDSDTTVATNQLPQDYNLIYISGGIIKEELELHVLTKLHQNETNKLTSIFKNVLKEYLI